jgi:NADPH:quinone reductase-like Zn-dependent oxidoreductase
MNTDDCRLAGVKDGAGPAQNLFIDEVPRPSPSATELLIRVKAFGLNRMDLSQRLGKYPVPPQGGPIMGVEFSGIVEQLGNNATSRFKIGDEVFGLTYGGAYSEYVTVEEGTLIHKPEELSWEEAAGIPEVNMLPYFV